MAKTLEGNNEPSARGQADKIRPADSSEYYRQNGDKYRLTYDLFSKAVVVDIGASGGDWSGMIKSKYGCQVHCFEPDKKYLHPLRDKSMIIYPLAVTGNTGTVLLGEHDGELSTLYTDNAIKVDAVAASDIFKVIGHDHIDLLKINVEGAEYEILNDLITSGRIKDIEDLQVQFHMIEGYEVLYENIARKLNETHCCKWRFPYVWEGWQHLKRMKYSQAGQDQFVNHFINHGTWVDIGCAWPDHLNNTLLLEENGWWGVNLDLQFYDWNRKTPFIQADALGCNWKDIFHQFSLPPVIDYLNLDIEGDGLRFRALKNIIKTGVEFKIITIEHDAYRGYGESERKPQRELLTQKGYDLVCSNVLSMDNEMEDWWINPKYLTGYEHLRCDCSPWKEIISKL